MRKIKIEYLYYDFFKKLYGDFLLSSYNSSFF